MTPLTQEQMQNLGNAVHSSLSEFFDGYVLVGFIAESSQAVTLKPPVIDEKTRIALAAMLVGAVPVINE